MQQRIEDFTDEEDLQQKDVKPDNGKKCSVNDMVTCFLDDKKRIQERHWSDPVIRRNIKKGRLNRL